MPFMIGSGIVRPNAAWSPASLFPANGGYWNVAASVAAGTIYTDDGTTAATTDGDLVYRINDLSGNANHLKQATSGSRPILRNSGAQWWLEFDGSAQYIKAAFTLAQPCTRINCVRQVSWTSLDFVWDGNTINVMRCYQSGVSPRLISRGSTVGPATDLCTVGANHVVTEIINGASSAISTGNQTDVTGDVGTGDPGGATIGSAGNGTSPANILWFGGVWIAGTMGSSDRALCKTFLGNLAGLSL